MHQPITLHHIMAQHFQNHRLSDFVKHGLRESGRSIETLLGRLALAQLQLLDNLVRFSPPATRTRKVAAGTEPAPTPDEFAFALYASFIANHELSAVACAGPVRLMLVSEAQYDTILAGTGRTFGGMAVLPETDLVVTAWNKARENRQRAHQRAGALLYLASQLKATAFGPTKALVEEEVNEALSALFRMAAVFQTTELEFALILGGEAHALSRKRVLESFGTSVSIIQYLQTDQEKPDRYSDEAINHFRTALEAYDQASSVSAAP